MSNNNMFQEVMDNPQSAKEKYYKYKMKYLKLKLSLNNEN